jgi:hypothetical protein
MGLVLSKIPVGLRPDPGDLLAHGFCRNGGILRIPDFWLAIGCRKADGGKSPSLSKQVLVFVIMMKLQRVRYDGIRGRTTIEVQLTGKAY